MNKQIERQDYLKLLNLLETKVITKDEFYTLLEFEVEKLKKIVKIIELEGLEEKNELVKKLMDNKNLLYTIFNILKSNPELRSSIEKRDYVIDNIKKVNIYRIIKLIQYDFIFNDKDLLNKLINFNKSGRFYSTPPLEKIDDCLLDEIKDNLELYQDSSKNKYISMALELPKNEYVRYFIELIKYKTCIDNPKWFEYIQECFKVNEEFNIEYVSDILVEIEETNKVDIVNQKLEQLDRVEETKNSNLSSVSKAFTEMKETDKHKTKLMLFDRLINNLYIMVRDNVEDDLTFNYLMDKIFETEEMFLIYLEYVKLFINDESLCKEGTEIYNTIMNCGNTDVMRSILDGFSTSISKEMDIEFIKKCITDKNNNPKHYLTQLAIDKGNIEYLQKEKPDLLLERFADSFVEYMSTHPDLTIEEILSPKQIIQRTQPEFKNGSYVIDIPIEEINTPITLKDKIKRIGEKIFKN